MCLSLRKSLYAVAQTMPLLEKEKRQWRKLYSMNLATMKNLWMIV